MYLGVCRDLPVDLVTEAQRTPFLSGHGRALTASCSSPMPLSDMPAAVRGLLHGEWWARCWLTKLGLFRWTLSRRVPGILPQAQESLESGPDGCFYKSPSPFGIDEIFYFPCFSMWAKYKCSAVLPVEPKHALWNYSCTRGYEKLHHVDLIIMTLVAS